MRFPDLHCANCNGTAFTQFHRAASAAWRPPWWLRLFGVKDRPATPARAEFHCLGCGLAVDQPVGKYMKNDDVIRGGWVARATD